MGRVEKILQQLLEGQQQLFEGQKQLFDGQKQLFESQQQLAESQQQLAGNQQQLTASQQQLAGNQQQLTASQQQLAEGQTQIIKRLDRIENTMVTKVDFDKAMNEGQKDIVALLERTATKDSITRLDTKVDLLNNKLFQTDTEIALLKIVK